MRDYMDREAELSQIHKAILKHPAPAEPAQTTRTMLAIQRLSECLSVGGYYAVRTDL
jgi:hypothetical protein